MGNRHYRIALPVAVLLLAALLLSRQARAQTTVTHTVQPGENLYRIALYYGTTVDAIVTANGMDTVYVYVGQRLSIPDATNTTPPSEPLRPPDATSPGEPTPIPTPAMPGIDARAYLVQSGDTLSGIAVRFKVSTWDLMYENGLSTRSTIYVGQQLIVPGGGDSDPVLEAPQASPTPEATVPAGETPAPTEAPEVDASAETYTVRVGDTLTQIASRLGTTVVALSRLNGIANPSQIYVGQVLRLTGSAPAHTGVGKLILVDLSDQHLYAYEGDQLVYSFVASTGAAPYYTRAGEFRIQSKIPNAYGSTWNIWMPHWLGIYWAGSTENGIHALPIMSNGQVLWAGYLGSPVSYGCVVLGTAEAELLYHWAEIGTPVSIQY